MGVVLLPGTAFVELAAHAGTVVGCARVAELTLQAPLVLAGDAAVAVQVRVGVADEHGLRTLTVHSRRAARHTEFDVDDRSWVCHAQGVVDGGDVAPVMDWARVWPPVGAQPVAVEDAYDQFAATGFEYGPVFQGLRAVWRRGQEVFAEVALPDEVSDQAARFGMHPALLDAALHTVLATGIGLDEQSQHQTRLPFTWNAVQTYTPGATALRVRITA